MRKFVILLLFISVSMHAKDFVVRVEPSNWWVEMKNPKLQLMLYGSNLATASISGKYNGVSIESISKTDNHNYLFLNLIISEKAKSGIIKIQVTNALGNDTIISFPLFARQKSVLDKKGVAQADAIYLITPDRFANGNPANDSLEGYLDKANRKKPNSRHGGDIKGIAEHLNYIKDMGFTAIWNSPLLENNMPKTSYHGYAITDFYKVDPRFGSNEEFVDFVKSAHSKGLKVIQDFVLNHCGSYHWWAKDLPTSDWYHTFPEFTRTTYRASTLIDPHASEYDKRMFEKGWFDSHMPDLNQSQPLLANYLIQNTIWWIETANLDGIRLDTQPYSEPGFLFSWGNAINTEYPKFVVVGEAWFQHEAFTASYQKNGNPISGYKSSIPSVTDFPLCFALNAAVNETDSWDTGMAKVYNVIAHDFLYADASKNMIFFDNHDLSRISEVINDSIRKYKLLVTMIATLRGIPQFYYGDEILLKGSKEKGDGVIRKDMPGGWTGDTTNVFTGQNLKKEQISTLEFTRKLFNWRKNNAIIASGTLKHFVPDAGLYVYARYNEHGTVLVFVNNNEQKSIEPEIKKYAEVINSYTAGYNPIDERGYELSKLIIPAKTAIILELK